MKVDKGVCTNGTLEDLNRAIQFEAVFSTLVENKILAIKRECELKKRHKKSRLLRRILFGRKISTGGAGGSGCCHREVSASNSNSSDGANAAIEPLCPDHNGTAGSVDRQQREGLDAGCYTYGSAVPEASLGVENSTISDGVDEVIVEIGDLSSLVDADGNVVVATTSVEPGVLVEEGSSPQVSAPNRASGASRISAAESSSTKSPESLENRKGSGRTLANAPRKSSLLEPVSIEIEPESDPLSAHYDLEDSATNVSIELDGVSDVSDMRRSIASEPISIIKNSTRSRYGLGSYLSAGNAVANRLRVLEAKSISAQNSPILPRQKPAAEGRHLTFSTATYQQPKSSTKASAIDCDTSFVVDLSQSDRDQEQQQQQQQQQHQHNNSTVIGKDKPTSQVASGGKKSALFLGDNSSSSSASKRNKLTQPHNSNHSAGAVPIGRAAHSAQQQQQQPQQQEAPSSPPLGLIESFNQLTASNLPVIASTARHSPPVSDLVKLQQHHLTNTRQQHHRPSSPSILLDSLCRGEAHPPADGHTPIPSRRASKGSAVAPIAGEGVSDAVSGTSAGAIQPLTASLAQPNQQQTQRKQRSFLKQSSCDVELHYRPNVTGTRRSSAKEHHSHRKSSAYGHGDDYSSYIMGYDINESDEEKLNKRKYKYLKRCSDPVIVFPSTSSGAGAVGSGAIGGSGLQHCILSRPPNQPLQFPYDEDFMYDVSLQIESERHGELDSIVPEHRRKHKHSRHHHHHHRHCKKKRHKKRKILVHDLDDQSVKVIDPDDLPQRARWTIIATACLLLIMCLLLVGITLRMAPIIDDMVRQENERLMRESLDRAKMIKNYTEYNRMIGGDEIP
ncbi:uncharacterized protein LOC5667262 isoform X1 [Anopheles gambiae]|uniref:uncharacterized protein LOC5667262 isoform X1 n=1 Tax=Anopheles gambiae TaxID=7165 RepID=UPI002AC92CF8|nr:uncharacterized protein LOC5667262 isoform X1 [Anopheles gambiae]XP_061506729.1 uncharacterized protein LOC5667262 isoform X1 [Anopheles gambiae]